MKLGTDNVVMCEAPQQNAIFFSIQSADFWQFTCYTRRQCPVKCCVLGKQHVSSRGSTRKNQTAVSHSKTDADATGFDSGPKSEKCVRLLYGTSQLVCKNFWHRADDVSSRRRQKHSNDNFPNAHKSDQRASFFAFW